MKLAKMTRFLDKLDDAGIHYTLSSITEGSITVGVTVPGEHWAVEFDDEEVEVEVFKSSGEIHDLSSTRELFEEHAEKETTDA